MKQLFCLVVMALQLSAVAQSITIDVADVIGNISPLIYGAGAEDVNHEIYGGLYDQRIFGEGFEEPAEAGILDFRGYDDPFTVEYDRANDFIMARINTTNHGKLIYQPRYIGKGTVSVDVRMDSGSAIAGFIYDVQEAGNGADNFRGYEVAIDASTKEFVLGKHDHNWQAIKRVATSVNPSSWNNIKIVYDGSKGSYYVNDNLVYEYEDTSDTPLMEGRIGIRSYGGSASFRNLHIDEDDVNFYAEATGVSKMWTPVGEKRTADGENLSFEIDTKNPFTGKQCQMIRGGSVAGILNSGLNQWGIDIEEGKTMHGSVYLRGTCPNAWVALQDITGINTYAAVKIEGVTSEWQKFEFDLTPTETDTIGAFTLAVIDNGDVYVDQVELYTDSYPFRSDLTEAFKNEHLSFLRYGGTMVNSSEYMSKNMIGERDKRQPYNGYWYKYATNGFAIPEFVEFARLIGAEPAFAINIEDNPQDVLAMLKEMEPNNPQMIEIGNEENLGTSARSAYEHYVDRFKILYDAIHPVYPDMQFINAAWWRADELATMEYVFHELDGKAAYWDYHPWTETPAQAKAIEAEMTQMKDDFLSWNPETTMKIAIFEENGNTHDMARALAHAYMLNNVRRTNGFVPLDSPANALQPYLQNDNGWDQGQIFFSPSSVWNQPPYYAQQMAATNHQPLLVNSTVSRGGTIDITATRNEEGNVVVIHAINYGTSSRSFTLNLTNFGEVKSIRQITLSGPQNGENTPTQPERYVPTTQDVEIGAKLRMPAYSYSVFVISADDASGISAARSNKGSDNCYDLLGRKVDATSDSAIVIQNGRKILK